ncbi:hypothetical protein GCM10027275_40570 [Rhabdobacter roseus]|uniref:Outer membrane protein/protective antigen OMA87 n=1 Tax=Rhabdobacter roseus TaxID=1655419 RepID=A0A840U1M2_9BACT|nr:hypothetical protein [Rhabdobacter roseus]MBB5286030.1 hypothetical protein [Rhabdobacter roseus]
MFRYLLLLLFLLGAYSVSAQNLDSLQAIRYQQDSIRYTKLKERMSRSKFSRQVYRLLFRDVYNKSTQGEVNAIDNNPFLPFEGLTIDTIRIRQLDILGQSVYDTNRTGNRLEGFVSRNFHTNTRERIIRKSFLLFKEGDLIDPKVLLDNERLLRANPIILDARILVIPRDEPEGSAELLILIQDVFSFNVSGSFSGFTNFRLGLDNINVAGNAHSHYNAIRWDARDTLQRFQFRSVYTIPYIGKTFITGQASFIWERDLKQQSLRFARPFITSETQYAGAFEMGHYRIQEYKRLVNDADTQFSYPVAFNFYDLWLGRSFKIPFKKWLSDEKTRLVVAFRTNNYSYRERPVVRSDTNRIYWNRQANYLSLGYSNRNYKRDVLIYGFGRTEDVPIGSLFAMTLGQETTQFGERGYGGVQYAIGRYLPKERGYVYALANFGSYFQSGRAQQGVLSGQLNYFSHLLPVGLSNFRQFVTLRYTYGIQRDPLEYLNISNLQGIRGINNDLLIGTKRLTLGLETVLFSWKSILGFRVAHFVFADLGLVNSTRSLWSGPLYQGYGLGVRLRNESLTFNTFQIQFGFYPNLPDASSAWRFRLDGVAPLRLPDFDISAPSIVPLR